MPDTNIKIRHTAIEDIPVIEKIFEAAREYMRRTGNPTQWKDNRPSMALVRADMDNGNSYVCEADGVVEATFAFIVGADPTYTDIDGAWLSDAPYGTVHRVASSGRVKGIAKAVFDWCKSQGVDVRIDTHRDNASMLHVIEKAGFVRCGVIIVDDGTPREAFQWQQK